MNKYYKFNIRRKYIEIMVIGIRGMTEVDFRMNSKKGRKPKGAKITLNQIDNVNNAIH